MDELAILDEIEHFPRKLPVVTHLLHSIEIGTTQQDCFTDAWLDGGIRMCGDRVTGLLQGGEIAAPAPRPA
jgi:hypothetical protein